MSKFMNHRGIVLVSLIKTRQAGVLFSNQNQISTSEVKNNNSGQGVDKQSTVCKSMLSTSLLEVTTEAYDMSGYLGMTF